LHQHGSDRAADASPAPCDQRMRRTRQSGHARTSPNELIDLMKAYILDFKLLQETRSAARGPAA